MEARGIDRLTLAAFALLVILAGGNAVGVKVATDELDPLWGAGTRFAAAGLIFAGVMALRRMPIPRGGALLGSVLYGIVGFGAAFGLAFIAIPMTGAGTGQASHWWRNFVAAGEVRASAAHQWGWCIGV